MKYEIKTLRENVPTNKKKVAKYVQLPSEIIEFLKEGQVIMDKGKRRYFMPYVFEKDIDDYGDVYKLVDFYNIPPDDIGLNHLEIKILSDEEFANKYGLEEYGTFKRVTDETLRQTT